MDRASPRAGDRGHLRPCLRWPNPPRLEDPALAREVERRLPKNATSKWWKEERHGVFVDYNQNARDRTTCSAYSVRPTPDARVSTPLTWDEVPDCDPAEFTLQTMRARIDAVGDLTAGMWRRKASLLPRFDALGLEVPKTEAGARRTPRTRGVRRAMAL